MEELTALGGAEQRPRSIRVLISILLVTLGCLLGSCMTRMAQPNRPTTTTETTSAPQRRR